MGPVLRCETIRLHQSPWYVRQGEKIGGQQEDDWIVGGMPLKCSSPQLKRNGEREEVGLEPH